MPDRNVEQRLRAAVDCSPSGLLMIDAAGRIVLVNQEVERLFGYSREDLLGRPVDMLVPERLRSGHPIFRAEYLKDPKVRSMGAGRELFGLRKDGSEVPIEIGLTPVATEEGLFVISSIVDITARKRAEARFKVAVESSPNGMVMVEAGGIIVLVNRELERLFGYTREELLGTSIERLVPERYRGVHAAFRTQFGKEPNPRAMGAGRDLFGLRKDGTEFPVEIGLNPIDTDEGMLVLGVVVDITARKQAERARLALEAQLRQAQKMEAVGTLAGGVAHDFNNILAAIIGYGEMLEDESLGDRARQDLGELLAAAARGKHVVQNILAFSRRSEPERKPLDLAETIQDMKGMLRASLPATIALRVVAHPETPRVSADVTAVQQVLMNLVTNSAYAMPDGGTLEILLEPFYARDSFIRSRPDLREGEYALLSVRDTGTGMAAGVKDRAFEPFFTTKGPGSGTGLGLSMVHAIIRDHDGFVEVESELGSGTEVRCLFPALAATEAAARPGAAPASEPAQGHGERVLLVEDEPSLLRMGLRRLEDLGYAATGETDPRRALEALRAGTFDLVLTDYTMPQMTGLDLAREASRLRPGILIVMLTGYVEDMSAATLEAAGIRRLLRKPQTLPELADAVRQVLDARRPSGPAA